MSDFRLCDLVRDLTTNRMYIVGLWRYDHGLRPWWCPKWLYRRLMRDLSGGDDVLTRMRVQPGDFLRFGGVWPEGGKDKH